MFIWCWWLCCPVSGSLFLVLLFFFMEAVDWGLHYVKRLTFLGGRVGAGQYQNFFVLAWGLPLSGGVVRGSPSWPPLRGGNGGSPSWPGASPEW